MFQASKLDANAPTIPAVNVSKREPQRDKVQVVVYSTLEGIDRTVKHLHVLHYADPNDWSDPIPTGKPNQWMSLLTRYLLIE
ncbi:MAG TPA: hypothetical protein V6D29_23400 [Leptolyngbyaceae cyanobacterium]